MLKHSLVIFISIFVLSSCSLFKGKEKKNKTHNRQAWAQKQFKKGSRFLDKEDYKSASKAFRSIIKKAPSTAFEIITLYNLGLSYEGMGRCKSASLAFRKVTKASAKKNPKLQTMSLYKLSKMYECLRRDTRVVSSLVDVYARRKYLPEEVAKAEVPARLAAAYARVGNRKMAYKYFKEAEKGLRFITSKKASIESKKEMIARTLFMMGQIEEQNYKSKQMDEYSESLAYMQRYLLQSVEINESKWSPRSAEELLRAYDHSWKIIDELIVMKKSSENAIQLQKQSNKIQKFTKAMISNIEALRRDRFPGEEKNKISEVLFQELNKKEKKFYQTLAENSVRNLKSKENEQRFGVKRKGKLVKPK